MSLGDHSSQAAAACLPFGARAAKKKHDGWLSPPPGYIRPLGLFKPKQHRKVPAFKDFHSALLVTWLVNKRFISTRRTFVYPVHRTIPKSYLECDWYAPPPWQRAYSCIRAPPNWIICSFFSLSWQHTHRNMSIFRHFLKRTKEKMTNAYVYICRWIGSYCNMACVYFSTCMCTLHSCSCACCTCGWSVHCAQNWTASFGWPPRHTVVLPVVH